MSKELNDTLSLTARSAFNHVRYIKPAAAETPSVYAGKVESTLITLLLDLSDTSSQEIPNRSEFFRFCSAFNLQWRAYDEVLDEERITTDPVTEKDLEDTSIWHPYMKRRVMGREGMGIALDSARDMISGTDPSSRIRKDKIEELLLGYRKRVADTANNPAYHTGPVLDFATATGTKEDVTCFLGETSATATSLLLDRNDQSTIELFKRAGMALQFGDDYLDWRKDLKDYDKKTSKTTGNVRPVENLLNATLSEYPEEEVDCRQVLNDMDKRSALWLKELAPKTLDVFTQRFQSELDSLPPHPQRDKVKGIISFVFYKLLPSMPESGWFFRWAKY